MRTAIPLAGVLLVAASAAVLVRGQPAGLTDAGKSARTITVTGSGTAADKPDTARVYLGVGSFAPTVAEARALNLAAVKKVQAAIAGLGLPDPKTRTTDTQVAARHEKDNPGKLLGYDVSVGFTVRLSAGDPERLAGLAEKVLDAGLSNGANAQGRVEFFLADDTHLRRQAMQAAVEDAVASAKACAAGGKVAVVEVASVEESRPWCGGAQRGLGNNLAQQAWAGGGEGGTMAAGNWSVTCIVKVVCRY